VHYSIGQPKEGEQRPLVVRVTDGGDTYWELDARTGAVVREPPSAPAPRKRSD
jgi:hypothetical protein